MSSSSWTAQTADVNIRLNNNLAANVQVSNWRDWYIGFGWLLLNNISLQPTNERQAYFELYPNQSLNYCIAYSNKAAK